MCSRKTNCIKLPSVFKSVFGVGKKRQLDGWVAVFVKWLAAATSMHIIWSVFYHPQPLVQRSVCLGLFMALVFLLYSAPGSINSTKIPSYDWVLFAMALSVSGYVYINIERLVNRAMFFDPVTAGDLIFGSLLVLLMMESTRRVIGPWLSALSVISISYILLGSFIPGRFGHTGFTFQNLIDHLFLTTDGIWGNTLGVATNQVVIFIIFGAFLLHSGAANFIFDFASAIAGWRTGGLAKVAVVTSGLFGMISGDPAGNISSMGSITIPMMKKSGYPAEFAASVECCASVGGTLMPPVMGSVAFIMAEVIGVPYREVALAALLPAVIYYLAIYFTVDFRARKLGLKGLDKHELPPLSDTLAKGLFFFLPIVFLCFRMLLSGLSAARVGIEAVCLVVLCSFFNKDRRMDLKKVFQSLSEGSLKGIMIAITMGCCGIIIGAINMTGLGAKFSSFLMALSQNSILATLFTVMFLSILLGLAMNISTVYLLTAVVAGPVMVNMGVPEIAAHLFILYYAAMATMTPPVAIAAFIAAGMAEAPPMKVGFQSMRMTLVAYFLPFIFVFSPALLLEGPWIKILMSFMSAVLAVLLMTMGLEGWWFGREMRYPFRISFIFAGVMALTGNLYLVVFSVILTGLIFLKGFGSVWGKRTETEAFKS